MKSWFKAWIVPSLLVKQVAIHKPPPNFKIPNSALQPNQLKVTYLKYKSERSTEGNWRIKSTFLSSISNKRKLSKASEWIKDYCRASFNWWAWQILICSRTGLNRAPMG